MFHARSFGATLTWAAYTGTLLVLLSSPSRIFADPSCPGDLLVNRNAAVTCPCGAQSRTDNTCGSDSKPFSCIQDAVDSTQSWNTICVLPGIYRESVTLDRSGTSGSQKTITATQPGTMIAGEAS